MNKNIFFIFVVLIMSGQRLYSLEEIHMKVKYFNISLVDLKLDYLKKPEENVIKVKSKSTKFCSFVNKFDNQYEAISDEKFLTKKYIKKINQEEYSENRVLEFNHDLKVGYRKSYLDSLRNREFALEDDVRDFFTTIFYLRENDIDSDSLFISANCLNWKVKIEKLGNEKIKTILGEKEAVKYFFKFSKVSEEEKTNSDIFTNNIVSADKDFYFWFSADKKRIPLKVHVDQKPFDVKWILSKYNDNQD